MDVIDRLREMMKDRGWSEYRLAKEAQLSQSTITNIFHRDTIPSIPTLKIICDAFGITLSQFFDEDRSIPVSQVEIMNDWSGLTSEQQVLVREIIKELKK